MEVPLCPGVSTDPAQFQPPFFDTPQSWGEHVLDQKGNSILDREINH